MQKKSYYSEFQNTQKNTCASVSFYRRLRLQMRARIQSLRNNTDVFYKQHFIQQHQAENFSKLIYIMPFVSFYTP